MPIPALDHEGFLPPGVHVCTMAELRERFGSFRGSDRRPVLFGRLQSLVDQARSSGLFCGVLVDGSFVTGVLAPNDIDVVLLFKPGHNFRAELTPGQYGVVNAASLRRQFAFDVVLVEEGADDYGEAVEFFQRVKQRPERKKGILRVNV